MMSFLFFGVSLGLIVYTYAAFPLWVFLRAKISPRPYRRGEITPSVSLIIAAHNEAACIGRKIENLLRLDYPRERLEIIIASDGSTDETESIVTQYASRSVKLLALPRGGKAQALNAAVAISGGEILVFSDANSMFEPGALRALVSPFADPGIGGVAGDQRYEKAGSQEGAELGERRYWDLDRWLKRAESQAGSVISATGAIYAIRRSLFLPVPEGVTDDFVTSTRVIAHGQRLVFADDAIAWEPVAGKPSAEFARKIRIITRGFRAIACMKCLLDPRRYGFYSVQLLSHKLLRRLMIVPLATLLISSLLLMPEHRLFLLIALSQLVFYFVAAVGAGLDYIGKKLPKGAAIPLYFCMVNVAAFIAAIRVITGRSTVLWVPQRAAGG